MLGRMVRPTGAPVFDPATLALSGWWRANYTGAPWAANASAGASLANGDLTTNTSDPTAGATQNGYTPADFDGTANQLRNVTTNDTTFFTSSAGGIVALALADTSAFPTGNVYDDARVIGDSSANEGLTFTTSGFTGFGYSGGYVSKSVACATGAYHLVMMRWDSSNLGMTLDSAAEVTQACGALTLTGTGFVVGAGYGGAHFFDGRILELMTFAYKPSNTDYANIKSYCNSRYALAL